jgi:hypothetical protein
MSSHYAAALMPTFGELFDHLSVEHWDVVGFAAGNQSVV